MPRRRSMILASVKRSGKWWCRFAESLSGKKARPHCRAFSSKQSRYLFRKKPHESARGISVTTPDYRWDAFIEPGNQRQTLVLRQLRRRKGVRQVTAGPAEYRQVYPRSVIDVQRCPSDVSAF